MAEAVILVGIFGFLYCGVLWAISDYHPSYSWLDRPIGTDEVPVEEATVIPFRQQGER